MVDSITQTQLLLQSQQKQVDDARQRAEQIQVRERPTMSQLLQRNIQSLPAIQAQEAAAQQYKAQKIAEVEEAQKEVRQSQAEFSAWRASDAGKAAAYIQSGGTARVIRDASGQPIGEKYGSTYIPYEKISDVQANYYIQKNLDLGGDIISPIKIEQRYTPIMDSFGNLKGFSDAQRKMTIPTEKLTATDISNLQKAGMIGDVTLAPQFGQYNPQLNPQKYFKELKIYSKPTISPKNSIIESAKNIFTGGMQVSSATESFMNRGQKQPTFSQLAEQQKNTKGLIAYNPLGLVYKGASEISKNVQLGLQKTGLSAGESKAVGESTATAALFGIFSPLMTSAMAKKGSKTVQVEEKKSSTISKKEVQQKATQVIRNNAAINPSANRDLIKQVLERAKETNNPQLVKDAQKLFSDVLGKEKTAGLFKDIAEQEGIYVRAAQPQQLEVIKPVAKTAAKTKPIISFAAETLRRKPTEYNLGVLYPSIVQAGGKAQSLFSGIGKYKISSGQLPKSIISLKQPQIETQYQIPKQISILQSKTESQLGFRQIQPLKSIQIAQPALSTSLKLSPQLQSKTESQLKSDLYNIQAEKAKLPFAKLPKSTFSLFKKKTIAFARLKAFEVQIKKRGKFQTIGLGLPKGRALRLGAARTMTTLSQTFRLVPKGFTSLKDIPYSVPSRIFTRPKKYVGGIAFVERRGMTLKRGTGEIPQIQAARRRLKWF